jgi:anti-sigma-K factor RskA
MSRLETLPADQRAVLQLLLKQGKTYEELASLLRLDRNAVRERALDALDALGPDAPEGLSSGRQDEIADYLLGQQSASERAATRDFLASSPPARAWARVVANELKPLAADGLPEIPADDAELEEAFEARDARHEARERQERSSKLGGVLVLAAAAIALVVVLVFLIGGGKEGKDGSSGATTTAASTTGTSQADGFLAQINLTAAQAGSKALGAGFVVRGQNNGQGLQVAAQGLPKSNRYAVWLTRPGGKDAFLGFARFAGQGRIIGVDPSLPKDWQTYRELVVTREPVDKPTKPGPVVLRGQLKS